MNRFLKRFLAAIFAGILACVASSTPGFARRGPAHGPGFVRDPTTRLGNPAPQMPTFENRIPAPLAPPSQAPAVNGPPARSPYGGVMH
jgi:hypothetical protein